MTRTLTPRLLDPPCSPRHQRRQLGMRRYTMNTLRQERLVDELVEAYIDWRETCARVNDALRGRAQRARVATSRSSCIRPRSTPKSGPPRSTPGLSGAPTRCRVLR